MKPLSFRLRIALLSVLISGAVLTLFGTAAYYLIQQERLAAVDREIRDLAFRHPGWMTGGANLDRFGEIIESVFGEARDQVVLLLRDPAGQTRFISSNWPAALPPATLNLQLAEAPRPPPPDSEPSDPAAGIGLRGGGARRGPPWLGNDPPRDTLGPGAGRRRLAPFRSRGFTHIPRFFTVRSPDASWRIGVLGSNGYRLVLGLNLADSEAELRRLRQRFLLALPLALACIGGGGWWIAGQAVRPLRSIAEVAQRVTARGLDQRIPSAVADPEIAQLVAVLNDMMDRLEASFHQATRFSADASHELKTPLAVMQGELEHALQSASPGSPDQQVYANLLEETHKLKAITQNLLLLARADAGQLRLALAPVNLSQTLGEWQEDLESLALETGLRVDAEIEPDLWVQADGALLQQAVQNLLHNSLRYNEPQGWIRLTLRANHQEVQLHISNSGPGIPSADQARIFDRFCRGDPARSRNPDGVGLGLSLAREIVRAHHGTLRLLESRPGHTCFGLVLARYSPANPANESTPG